jgi:ATP-dependent DNA ligase
LQYKHIRTLLHWGYTVSVANGKILAIESISVQLKKEYWAEVQVLEIDRDEKIKAAKGLYFMAWRANFKK